MNDDITRPEMSVKFEYPSTLWKNDRVFEYFETVLDLTLGKQNDLLALH